MATKLIVMTGFLVAFAAGLVTGMQSRQVVRVQPAPQSVTPPRTPGTSQRVRPPAFFIDQLHLTAAQSEKWQKIWSEVADRGGRGQQQRVNQLRQEREAKILALIPLADRVTYDKIQKDFSESVDALDKEWRDSYDEAVRKTKEILTDSQRRMYETILIRNQWDRGRGGPGPRRGGSGGGRTRGQNPSDAPRNDQQPRQTETSATTRSASN
jgi:hypothetical protein